MKGLGSVALQVMSLMLVSWRRAGMGGELGAVSPTIALGPLPLST